MQTKYTSPQSAFVLSTLIYPLHQTAYLYISKPLHFSSSKEDIHTQSTARNTSVTLNLFSTLQAASISSLLSTSSSSPINVSAHRNPHHTAGAVLRARQKRRGKCQCFSTPSRTATRGCSTEFLWSGCAGCRFGGDVGA